MNQPMFGETFHKLLLCLAISDNIFILTASFTSVVKSFGLLEKFGQGFGIVNISIF